MIVGLFIALFGMATMAVMKLAVANARLRTRLMVAEAQGVQLTQKLEKLSTLQKEQNSQHQKLIDELMQRTTPAALSKDQAEFKQTLELKWKTAMEQAQTELAKSLTGFRSDFAVRLTEEFKKACDSIDFQKVEYKKTITKKRQEFSRKNKATKPQRQHRSIDDE